MMASMLVEAEIWTVARTDQGNAVLVRPLGSEVAVPIFIGQLELNLFSSAWERSYAETIDT